MKAVFVNGSPRKEWNTHQVLLSAAKGAESAGAETEIVHLADYSLKGCMSCFACKLKGAVTGGVCAWRDDLRPVMERVMEADVLVVGSPVYFGTLTAQTHAFLERLLFPVLNYMPEVDGFRPRTLPREKRTALVLTMNVKESMLDAVGYRQQFGRIAGLMGGLLGSRAGGRSAGSEILYVCDTWQFTDYAKYDADMFDEGAKRARREGFFAEDLEKAHELGRRLCSGGDAD